MSSGEVLANAVQLSLERIAEISMSVFLGGALNYRRVKEIELSEGVSNESLSGACFSVILSIPAGQKKRAARAATLLE